MKWKNNKNSALSGNLVSRCARNKNSALGGNLVSPARNASRSDAGRRCARNNKKGSLAIELLLVIAIINIALVSLLGLASFSLRSSSLLKESSRADSLAQEALEAVRNFRDGTTWATDGLRILSLDTAYHPEKTIDTPPKWNLITGEETINGFSRKIVIKKVFRDVNGNIAGSGTEDPDARKIIATVTWKDKKVEIVNYLTNWRQ